MPSAADRPGDPDPTFRPSEQFNMVDYFLEDRIREGKGERVAIHTDEGSFSYAQVAARTSRFGNLLLEAGVEPEQRVLIALSDGPDFVAALFGTLKMGGVAVMANPHLRTADVAYLLEYTRAKVALTHEETRETFQEAAAGPEGRHLKELLVLGTGEVEADLEALSAELATFPSHRDDAAIWLFSGGTTGRPKAVVQSHTSYANSTECYAKGVMGYSAADVTLSVPKLFFGYATGSNLLFPFAVGGATVLFHQRCTPEALFQRIERFRPTILVNVPTMVQRMVDDPTAPDRDLSSLRAATSAGEALAVELNRRWKATFGVELLDGLGTAEMWHIFISNRPGRVRPGTLGEAVPGFEVRVCDEDGRPLPDGEVGFMRVRGNSRAIQYWQRMERTREAFQGEWYVSGDMISRSPDGFFTYHGRGDDMLKVSGKWLAPGEVENRLLQHPGVREVAVVGVPDAHGLVQPHAFVVVEDVDGGPAERSEELAEELRAFVRERLATYKAPRHVHFLPELPRTHLGKVDRGGLRDVGARAQ
jgi:benzoate-CoA ligase family protein